MSDPFDEFFKRMMKRFFKDFEDIEKELRSKETIGKPPEWVIKAPGGYVTGSGFSISISSNGRGPPKIEVRRFGPSGKWEKVPLEKGKVAPTRPQREYVKMEPEKEKPEGRLKERIIPEYNVSVDVNEVMITICAEGVESEEDVRLKFYPESVEIYALAPKLQREYFCTVALPTSTEKRSAKIKIEKGKVIVSIPRKIRVV
jgi:HSP20 family molecular chaperone IbpA